MLDGETSTLDLEGLSLDELPHALLHLRVDAVLADTERLSEDEASLLRAYSLNSRSEENFIRNTSIFGAWNTAYSMEYVEYGWNTARIQASGRSFGIRGKRIHTVGFWPGPHHTLPRKKVESWIGHTL